MTAEASGGKTASSTPIRTDSGVEIEEFVIAVAVLALGVAMVVGALSFDGGAGYQVVGPAAFPMIVGVLGLVCGAILTVTRSRLLVRHLGWGNRDASPYEERRSEHEALEEKPTVGSGESEESRGAIGWRGVCLLAALLIGYAVLLVPVGFWQLTGLVFALATKIFGGKRLVRNLIIGYVLALVVYFLFDRLLGVGLPDGYIRIAG